MRSQNVRLARAFMALSAVLVVALMAVVAPSVASESGADDEITACVKNSNGRMRIPGKEQCRKDEYPLVWSRNAPVEQSPLTVNLRERQQPLTIPPTGNGAPVSVATSCEPGEVVVGGGLAAFDAGVKSLKQVASGPFSDGTTSGWTVSWINEGPDPVNTAPTVSALCVRGAINNIDLNAS